MNKKEVIYFPNLNEDKRVIQHLKKKYIHKHGNTFKVLLSSFLFSFSSFKIYIICIILLFHRNSLRLSMTNDFRRYLRTNVVSCPDIKCVVWFESYRQFRQSHFHREITPGSSKQKLAYPEV